MQKFIDYINKTLPDKKGDTILYRFKKKTLDDMAERAMEITSHGLKDSKVVDDLVISEHADLKSEYMQYYKKETAAIKAKRNTTLNIIGSAMYLIVILTSFLAVSMFTHRWDMTWAIVVDGILLWVDYLLFLGVKKFTSMKRIFHIFARLCLAAAVVVFTVAAFLFVVAVTDIQNSWVLVILGIILGFVCDGVYASVSKQRLAVITWIIYIPIISTFLFVIIGALNILKWSEGWILIPIALIIDLIIILVSVAKNRLQTPEVEDIWKEN